MGKRSSIRSWTGAALLTVAGLTGAVLVPQAAHAATPLSGQVTYNGAGVAGVEVEFFRYVPDEGYWTNVADADDVTDAAGNWSYSGTLGADGSYAVYYYTKYSDAVYASSQAAGGVTNVNKLAAQFTVTGGVASTSTIASTPLVVNAGAVAVTVRDGLTGAVLADPAVPSANVGIYDGFDSAGNDLESVNIGSTGTFTGTVRIPGVQPGIFYDVYASSISGYDSADTYPTNGVTVIAGQTTPVDAYVFPSGTPSARTLVAGPRAITVSGLPKVGTLLTASVPATSATVAYRWYSDGDEIAGATSATYAPTAKDLGAYISVTATVSAPGYATDYLYMSDDAKRVQVGDPNQAVVTVTGTAKFGKSLKATVSGGDATAISSYQWYRNGAPISGADGSSYALAKADVGQKVFASVTSVVQGHSNAVIPSNTVAVAHDRATVTFSSKTSISKGTKLKVKVNLKDGASKNAATGTIRVYYSSSKYKKLSFTSKSTTKTTTLPALAKGKHTIKIKYYGDTHYLTKSTSFRVTVK